MFIQNIDDCKVKKNMVLLVDYVLNIVLSLKPIHVVNQISVRFRVKLGWLHYCTELI